MSKISLKKRDTYLNLPEYDIKDEFGINCGYITFLSMSKKEGNCFFRLKLYKNSYENYELFYEVLKHITDSLIIEDSFYKVNFVCDINTNTKAITSLGYSLEGILYGSTVKYSETEHELLFGISKSDYRNNEIKTLLRLKAQRVELRILTPEDSEEMLNYYINNMEHLRNYEPTRDPSFYSLEVQKSILVDSYKGYLNGHSLNFGIYNKNKLIGKVQLSNIVEGVFKNAFVGYSIDKDNVGNGYMKEALMTLIDYAFYELELHRIEASTLVDNIRSQNVLTSCGFSKIGLCEKYLFINGKWRDHYTYYILKE